MSLHYGVPVPKPEPMRRTKARKDRLDAKQLTSFRDAVWARERKAFDLGADVTDAFGARWARCQNCDEPVSRGVSGEVHHRIGRRAKATRYDTANGVLLCSKCHGKAQRHEITV